MNTNSREVTSWHGSSLVNLLQEIANNWSGACPRTYAVMLTDLLDINELPPVRFSEAFFNIASRPQAPTSTSTSSSSTSVRVLETSAATGAKILETTAASAARSLENTSSALARMVEDATAAATRYLETSVATMVKSLEGTIGTAVGALENATSSITRKVPVTVSPPQLAEEEDDDDTVETSCIPSTSAKPLKDQKLTKLFLNLGAKPFSKPDSKNVLNQGKDLLASKGCGISKQIPSVSSPAKLTRLSEKTRSSSTASKDDDNIFLKPVKENSKSSLTSESRETDDTKYHKNTVPNEKKKILSGSHSRNPVRKNSKASKFLSQSIFLGTKSEKPTASGIKAASPSINQPTISISKAGTTNKKSTTPSNMNRLKLAFTLTPLSIKEKLKVVRLLAGAKGTPLSTKTVTRANARHNPRLKRLQKAKRPMLTIESPSMFTPTKK